MENLPETTIIRTELLRKPGREYGIPTEEIIDGTGQYCGKLIAAALSKRGARFTWYEVAE